MLKDIRGSSMLERTSRFVLEVLPYLLSAVIAAFVVPGFLYSQVQGTKVTFMPNVSGLEIIHRDHAGSADSDEVARAFRDDAAHGFRHDVAQGAGLAGC